MEHDLAAVVRDQLEILRRQLPKVRHGDARGIHRARVASRRLREIVPVGEAIAPSVRRSKLSRYARRVTASLGPVREMDVALKEFEAAAARREWRPEAMALVRTQLQGERDRRARRMVRAWDRRDIKALEARVEAMADVSDGADPGIWVASLSSRLRKRAARFRDALRAAGTLYAADPIHEVRIAAKKLRYTLELARTAAGADVGHEIGRLKRLQDLLGRVRDLQVLADHAHALSARRHRKGLSTALEQIQHDLETDCREHHAQFVKRSARCEDLAERVARVPALLLLPRTARRMAVMRAAFMRRREEAS